MIALLKNNVETHEVDIADILEHQIDIEKFKKFVVDQNDKVNNVDQNDKVNKVVGSQ